MTTKEIFADKKFISTLEGKFFTQIASVANSLPSTHGNYKNYFGKVKSITIAHKTHLNIEYNDLIVMINRDIGPAFRRLTAHNLQEIYKGKDNIIEHLAKYWINEIVVFSQVYFDVARKDDDTDNEYKKAVMSVMFPKPDKKLIDTFPVPLEGKPMFVALYKDDDMKEKHDDLIQHTENTIRADIIQQLGTDKFTLQFEGDLLSGKYGVIIKFDDVEDSIKFMEMQMTGKIKFSDDIKITGFYPKIE